jgi:hypothetical protein
MSTTATGTTSAGHRYLQPGWFTRNVFNRVMARSTRMGLSVHGSRVLHVRGRSTGEWRTIPVNPLTIDGRRYLVAPRGTTQWVRNIRSAGGGMLQLGRRHEQIVTEESLGDSDKVAVLRRYLAVWKWEVGVFFDGIGSDATDQQIQDIAHGYPVFAIRTVA